MHSAYRVIGEMLMPSPVLLMRLARLNTSIVSDALDAYGLSGATTGLLPINHRNKMVGQASTVQLAAITKRKGKAHFLSAAIRAVEQRNRVLVVAGGVDGIACWDSCLNAVAAKYAIAGAVIDGMCRLGQADVSNDYPLFGTGLTTSSGERRVAHLYSEVPVVVAGVVVHPGDYVIADRCGTAFILSSMIEAVLASAERIANKKTAITKAIRSGQPLLQIMPEQQLEAAGSPPRRNAWGNFRL